MITTITQALHFGGRILLAKANFPITVSIYKLSTKISHFVTLNTHIVCLSSETLNQFLLHYSKLS